MFDKIGQMMGMLKNLPKLQAAMAEMQQKLGQISVDGNAGAGMVVVAANGRMEITKCVISDEAYKLGDKDMLADLVIAATNMALAKAREEAAKVTQQLAADAGLPLPAGMLPGM
jgi:DNA-binding YbaB/EbfC family protein